MAMRPHHLPLRLITGAFILNSGLGKRRADDATAGYLHAEAARAYPFLKEVDPRKFTKLLSAAEITLGSALLVPAVPSAIAGAGLTGFAAGLLGLYFTDPDARERDGIRPSQQGIALAKDGWLLAIGLSLLIDRSRPRRAR
ncbi:hypothetical protein [Marinitenerispora sediminis]|uniref:DoxX family membrane protein n=1 Tax=Marinitenerispora sediminis TaxID=1931232 RepID=A0A368T9R2_9ACTN|nr:hypothetical protein [Marinitenerispora sediminis]RCV54764.1 hypothetical protein DEF28_07400 [Marinitenerispora sediminis]RCV60560.1 hypothetical protein DEF23_04365 [Marinitenerispora sediminis]RCV61026.1 hypothetical protein DEF24_05265 [Marinitenerispora sediminis]